MSIEENKAIHRRAYEEIWNKKNLAVVDEVIAADYVYHGPCGREFKGPEDYKQLFHMLLNAFPDLNWNIEDMIAEGDKVVCHSTMRGTHKGEYMGIAATGRQFSLTEIAIVRIKNSRIAEEWGGSDGLDFLRQLGATPSQYEHFLQEWNK